MSKVWFGFMIWDLFFLGFDVYVGSYVFAAIMALCFVWSFNAWKVSRA